MSTGYETVVLPLNYSGIYQSNGCFRGVNPSFHFSGHNGVTKIIQTFSYRSTLDFRLRDLPEEIAAYTNAIY